MAAATRIYLVGNENVGGNERLVEASSQSQAERHVASPIRARVASQADLVHFIGAGVQVEKAGEHNSSSGEAPEGGGGGGGRANRNLPSEDAE